MRDYYSVLDVPVDATQNEIKRAYWKSSAQHSKDSLEYQEISRAWEILGNEQLREEYDSADEIREDNDWEEYGDQGGYPVIPRHLELVNKKDLF